MRTHTRHGSVRGIAVLVMVSAVLLGIAVGTRRSISRFRAVSSPGFTVVDRDLSPDKWDDAASALTVVESIELDWPSADDFRNLKRFPELKFLFINGSFDGDLLNDLSHVPDLQGIEITGMEHMDDSQLSHLRHCGKLKWIRIGPLTNEVTGDFLSQLTCTETLERLEVWSAFGFKDDVLRVLKRFRNLRSLALTECRFNGSGFHVFSEMQQLQRVEIDLPNDSVRKHFAHIPDVSFNMPE